MDTPPTATVRRRRALLLVLLAVTGAFQAAYSLECLRLVAARPTVAQIPFGVRLADRTLAGLEPAAAEAGLQTGDLVLTVAGRPWRGRFDVARPVRELGVGGVLAVSVRRGEERIDAGVRLSPVPADLGRAEPVLILLLGVVTPLLCFTLGFLVAWLRPLDPRAWIVLLLMLTFSHLVGLEIDLASWSPWPVAAAASFLRGLLSISWPLALFLLGVAFPERLELDRRRPWLKWLVLAPLGVVCLTFALSEGLAVQHASLSSAVRSPLAWLGPRLPVAFAVVIGLFFAMIGHKGGKASSPDARRRLRLLIWGSGVSLSPVGLLVLAAAALGLDFGDQPVALVVAGLLPLVLFPITLAYVIVVEQALDVRVVVRQGLQYALARNGVVVLQVVVSFLVLLGAVTLAADPGANRPRRITFMAAGIAFIFLLQGAAERLRRFVDRRFFREAWNAEQLLLQLGDDLRTVVDPDELLATVTRRLAGTLHADAVVALVARDGRFVPARGAGLDTLPDVALPLFSPVAERLRLTRQPLRLHWSDPAGWIARHVPEPEQAALRSLRSELLLPLAAQDRLLGILSLGPRRSEEPWAPAEIRVLQTVAAQASVALENAQLTAAIAAEVARRERLNREIEIAREVQEGLFPQELPVIPSIELAGLCRPALGVGGDYYDFLALPGERLGLAVGDVSGKGIPAALLMAALRAALRAQESFATADVATLMERLNQLIYESSPPNRYVTFFYGQYDPATRKLVYVNAGHLPPMIFREGATTPIRLEDGGPVVGLLPIAPYTSGSVDLRPGDLLVAYSDGVSEAMNAVSEEYGEDRLCHAVLGAPVRSAPQVVRHVFASVEAFVGTAPQHDDITLIALRAS